MLSRGTYHRLDGEVVRIAPVTLPALEFLRKGPPVDTEPERREIATKFLEARTIKAGAAAWGNINRSQHETFDHWKAVAAVLIVGRRHVLRATGANAPMGRRYSLAFNKWAQQNHLNGMPSAQRSMALQLGENIESITLWRSGLPERERKRLTQPQSIVNRWKAATAPNGKSHADLRRDAKAAWARFRSCLEGLPSDQAAPLWAIAQAQASEALCR
jgi:hypothetical protein